MVETYQLVYDEVILKQLKKIEKDANLKNLFAKFLDKIAILGPFAGKMLDPILPLYEVKCKRPPLRIYFRIDKLQKEAYLYEFEMKTDPRSQFYTIERIKQKARLKP